MKLILRTTALLAFANAISLQTETATYESRMSASFVDQATLLAETTMDTETWLADGLDIIAGFTKDGREEYSTTEDNFLEVKTEDLEDFGKAYHNFSEFLKGNPEGITVDEAYVNKLLKAFESSLEIGNLSSLWSYFDQVSTRAED